MLSLEFILTDVRFAVGLAAALTMFATMWLYLDAWMGERHAKELFKWAGCGALALGFALYAVQVEPQFIHHALLTQFGEIGLWLRIIGYVLLAVGLAQDHLQPRPKTDDKAILEEAPAPVATATPAAITAPAATATDTTPAGAVVAISTGQVAAQAIAGVAVAAVAVLYWRRATQGLERHLRPVAWAFSWLTAFELLQVVSVWRGNGDPRLSSLVAPFGPIWVVDLMLLLVGATILGRWVWGYLTRRLQTELFMVITMSCLTIFLVTTISFTFLLMSRLQAQTVDLIKSTASVLQGSLASQQTKTDASAQLVVQDAEVVAALTAKDHARLAARLKTFLPDRGQSQLVITGPTGQVLYRAEDPASWGDSVSSDPLVERALAGKTAHGLTVRAEGGLSLQSVQPVKTANGTLLGAVAVGFRLDNAFVDGLQTTSGLITGIYQGSQRVATTLTAADGQTRLVGVTETRSAVTNAVLKHHQTWSGLSSFDGRSYLAVFAPLLDADNAPIGMLLVAQPQTLLLQAAGSSIEYTFLVAVGLMMLAIGPVFLISRALAKQVR